MQSKKINIEVQLDDAHVPEKITWSAPDARTGEVREEARAMLLSFWDSAEKTTMRIDLWTKELQVEEMVDFFYQTIFSMADTYKRAVPTSVLDEDLRTFARTFYDKHKREQTKN